MQNKITEEKYKELIKKVQNINYKLEILEELYDTLFKELEDNNLILDSIELIMKKRK